MTTRQLAQALVTRIQLSEPGDNATELVRQLVALAADVASAAYMDMDDIEDRADTILVKLLK